MKQPASESLELRSTRSKKRASVDIVHSDDDDGHLTRESTGIESVKKELREIRDLLESLAHKDREQRYKDEEENELKNDWMLAAAVLDRICAIAFTVVFIGVTVTFLLVCAMHS